METRNHSKRGVNLKSQTSKRKYQIMKKTFLLFTQILIVTFCFAQDVIIKVNGEEIKSKILEVNQTEVKYKNFDYQSGPSYTVSKSEIFMIRYQNGTKDVFNDTKSKNGSIVSIMPTDEMRTKGREDAINYYRGKNSGAGWTMATSIITSPLFALIPAVACSSSEPSEENLNAPSDKLMRDADYKRAYVDESHRIKKKRIWKNFAIGSGVWLGVIILLGSITP